METTIKTNKKYEVVSSNFLPMEKEICDFI